ncbi:MAG: hypothetical protein M0Q90_17555 [Bacteroidales bacterium]|nr:hypothetical protein [Bacteroidales bacterium]
MPRFAHFSRHALKRIGQRTTLNYFSIADMLDFGGAVDIGSEIVFDRRHWLFYSEEDNCCFVAIQDAFTGLVITILPLDYHENLAWKIKDEHIEEAKRKSSSHTRADVAKPKEPPSIIIVKARYISVQGYQKTSTLTKFRSSDYRGDLYNVLNDKSLESEIRHHCKIKGIDHSSVYAITIALGNDGEPLVIDWKSNSDE